MCGDIGDCAAKCCMKRLMHNGSGNMFACHARELHVPTPLPPYIHTHTPFYPPLYIDIPMLIGLAPLKNLLTHQCRKFALQIMRARANNAENCPKKKEHPTNNIAVAPKFAYEANVY